MTKPDESETHEFVLWRGCGCLQGVIWIDKELEGRHAPGSYGRHCGRRAEAPCHTVGAAGTQAHEYRNSRLSDEPYDESEPCDACGYKRDNKVHAPAAPIPARTGEEKAEDVLRLKLEGGKYEFVFDYRNGAFSCLRNGEPWREFTGDKAVLALLQFAASAGVSLAEEVAKEVASSPDTTAEREGPNTLEQEALALCHMIEALSASAQQTELSLKASGLRQLARNAIATECTLRGNLERAQALAKTLQDRLDRADDHADWMDSEIQKLQADNENQDASRVIVKSDRDRLAARVGKLTSENERLRERLRGRHTVRPDFHYEED